MLSESMEVFIREHEEEALELLRTIARIPAPSNHEDTELTGATVLYLDEYGV